MNRMFWGKEQRFHFMKNRSKRPKACPGVIGIKFEDSIFSYIIDSIFYYAAEHIIRHFKCLVFDAIEHVDVSCVIPLEAQKSFFLRHFQMTVQHTITI